VFFSISGAEAVEIALKTAVAATGRSGILAFEPSYHGLTLGALAVTSRPEFRAPFRALLHPQVQRLPFACDPGRIEELLRSAEVAAGIAAVIVEPIVGREGVLVPPPGWLARLAGLCRAAGTVLIADEIFTGFGRTGTLFAVEAEDVRPDLLCCGKALGGGLPIAAVVGRRTLFRVWETPGEALHTATFLANPLACAAALAVLEVLEREALPARAARLGAIVGNRCAAWRERFPETVAALRGRGLLWGVELATADIAKRWTWEALQRGLLLLAGGPEGKVAQLVPPLTISEEQLAAALALLEEGLSYSRQ
jgi:4-aminobutyrate aminotransferase-like enzyme